MREDFQVLEIKGNDPVFKRLSKRQILELLRRDALICTLTRVELRIIVKQDPLFSRLRKKDILEILGAEKQL